MFDLSFQKRFQKYIYFFSFCITVIMKWNGKRGVINYIVEIQLKVRYYRYIFQLGMEWSIRKNR